ncbi:MAG: glycosyltransferase family 2 protein [bacterium]|nr:glycosyltransferase family 2 protein [bacterium]
MKTLAISLVTYNGAGYIRECLESVKRQTLHDIEVIIIDNASTDETVAIVREVCPDARLVVNAKNVAFAAGHNQAIRMSTAVFVLVLNQDSILEPDYCEQLVEYALRNPGVGSMTGTILRCDSLTNRPKNPIVDSQGMFIKSRYFMRLRAEGEAYVPGSTAPLEVFGVPATTVLYRREALEDVAGPSREYFDEDFFMYKEDVDLAYRLQWRGWKSILVPSAIAWHIRSKRLGSRTSKFINELSYRNTFLYQWKNVSGGLFWRVGLSMIFFESLKFLYSLFRERSSLVQLRIVWNLRTRMSAKRAWIMNNRKVSNLTISRFY